LKSFLEQNILEHFGKKQIKMTFLLEDHEKHFIGCFRTPSESSFTFMITNFEKFMVEHSSLEDLMARVEDLNENYRYKKAKVLKTLKDSSPVSSVVDHLENSMQINLNFTVGGHPLKVFFIVRDCDPEEIGQIFAGGLMKLVIENSLMISKLKRAVEAKDLEIEDYKRNGATLIRGENESSSDKTVN
jgi:hypothetical protein